MCLQISFKVRNSFLFDEFLPPKMQSFNWLFEKIVKMCWHSSYKVRYSFHFDEFFPKKFKIRILTYFTFYKKIREIKKHFISSSIRRQSRSHSSSQRFTLLQLPSKMEQSQFSVKTRLDQRLFLAWFRHQWSTPSPTNQRRTIRRQAKQYRRRKFRRLEHFRNLQKDENQVEEYRSNHQKFRQNGLG